MLLTVWKFMTYTLLNLLETKVVEEVYCKIFYKKGLRMFISPFPFNIIHLKFFTVHHLLLLCLSGWVSKVLDTQIA